MNGREIKAVWAKLYELHELIRVQDWEQLKRIAGMTDDDIEEAKFAIADYPGEMTTCGFEEFIDAVRIGDYDGWKCDTVAQLWFDGEESDLSMECTLWTDKYKVTRVVIEQIHVF